MADPGQRRTCRDNADFLAVGDGSMEIMKERQ